tara:strand:- start:957 stop:1136 length:180 start_codon:yes stop_codon:yes gene_type:complete
MKKINNRKRFFLKSTIPLLLSLTAVRSLNINLITFLKTRTIKFFRKGKKIWILSINDFK